MKTLTALLVTIAMLIGFTSNSIAQNDVEGSKLFVSTSANVDGNITVGETAFGIYLTDFANFKPNLTVGIKNQFDAFDYVFSSVGVDYFIPTTQLFVGGDINVLLMNADKNNVEQNLPLDSVGYTVRGGVQFDRFMVGSSINQFFNRGNVVLNPIFIRFDLN